jgi:hypothetical protein
MLWKMVLDYATEEFREQAEAFLARLQESVQPADALQGLLLDRIAAGYLRKRMLLEAEAATRETLKQDVMQLHPGLSAEARRRHADAKVPLQADWTGNILRYEALLDQALHRDLILLQQLKKAALAARVVSAQKPQQSNRGLIEGDVGDSHVG